MLKEVMSVNIRLLVLELTLLQLQKTNIMNIKNIIHLKMI